MSNCETYEVLVSTWIDGQLDRRGQTECLDHLVRCESCREFYIDARALDGLVAGVRTPAAEAKPSPEVWKRIEWVTRADRKRAFGIRPWAMQAAAVLVIALGLTVAVWKGSFEPVPPPEQAEVTLGEGGEMTAERFVELTKEVLRADRRYHSAMREIMEQVADDTSPRDEASTEGSIQRNESGYDGERAESGIRAPA